jgi:hypothetical protein
VRRRRTPVTWAVLLLVSSCGDTGKDEESTASPTTSGMPTTTSMPTTSSAGTSDESGVGSSSAATSESSTGVPEPCEGSLPGEWADCIDDDGEIDLTPCMLDDGAPGTGTPFCLTSATDPMAGTCTVLSCETDCDCFAMPTTGTAPAKCGAFVEGGKACALPCGGEAVCPDGMECSSGLCFWPASGALDSSG